MRKFGLLLIAFTTSLAPCFGKPTATIVKTGTEMQQQGCFAYHFVFDDFPVNRKIDMLLQRILQPERDHFKSVHTLKIDSKGNIQVDGQSKSSVFGIDPIEFVSGERVTYRFQDGDEVLCEASCIPRPLTALSKEGTFTMEGELLTADLTVWQLKFQGIEEKEPLSLISMSCGEVLVRQCEYRSHDIHTLLPAVIGVDGGFDEVSVRRANGDQALLVLPWGTQLTADLRAQKALFER